MHYPIHIYIIHWFKYKGRIHIQHFCFNTCSLVQTFAFAEQTSIYAQDVASLVFCILSLTPQNKELFVNDQSASQEVAHLYWNLNILNHIQRNWICPYH
jgi:hypothetical protein